MSCLNCDKKFYYFVECKRCIEEKIKYCEKKVKEEEKEKDKYVKKNHLLETQNKELSMQINELKSNNEKINKQFSIEKEKYDKNIPLLEEKNKELRRQIKELKTNLWIEENNKEKFKKQFSTDFDNVEAEKFYDIIVGIDSIKKIKEGWKVRFSEEGNKIYKKNETKDCIKIGVVGNGNKGKSFLLNKLSNFDLPSSTTIRTEGLSLKYPDLAKEKDKNIILLDSAGTETPLIMSDEELKDEKLKDDKNYQDKIEDLAKDKTLTELFLQNIIITTSDLLILVFGILTYSE